MKAPRTKRQQQALETREKIVNCALRLFGEKGFDNVSMEMIAEETNTSIGAIYHHFSGKEEIAAQTLASLDEGYEEYFEYLMEDEAAQALTPLKKLEEYFVFVQIRSSETKSLNYAYIHDLRDTADTMILGVSKDRMIYQNYEKLIRLCQEKGELPQDSEAERIISVLTQVSRGLLVDWMLQKQSFDIEDQARILIHIVLQGLAR